MGLALLAVFLVTLVVLANLWTCLMVFTCVGFTLVSSQHVLSKIIFSVVPLASFVLVLNFLKNPQVVRNVAILLLELPI